MTSGSDTPVLVVGGRGFVGRAAVRRLLADGRQVTVFGPDSPVPLPAGAHEIRGSITDGDCTQAFVTIEYTITVVTAEPTFTG